MISAAGLELLSRMAGRRAPVSQILGVLSEKLFLFHAMYTLADALYEIPELDCIVAARTAGKRMTVYDVVGEQIPSFEELYPFLATPTTREVAFYFSPDQLLVDGLRWTILPGNNLHDRGDFPLREDRIPFPFTAHA